MKFKLALVNYLVSQKAFTETELNVILNTIKRLRIPMFCILNSIYYFENCLNKYKHTFIKFCSALYLGYRIFHDSYISIGNWTKLTTVPKRSIIKCENQILYRMNYSVHLNTKCLDSILDRMITAVFKPMGEPMSPMISPRSSTSSYGWQSPESQFKSRK
eukprot:NODE_663_length_4918_cov_0.396140.p4 type:complete len:160 gc:universal NODE_663_length_4918_cov_0.396140:4289-3810(-)